MRHWSKAAIIALVALLPLTMAPTGGLPSRPTFAYLKLNSATSAINATCRSSASANNRCWATEINGSGDMFSYAATDAGAATGTPWRTVDRTNAAVDQVVFTAESAAVVARRAGSSSDSPFFQWQTLAGASLGYMQAVDSTNLVEIANTQPGGALNLVTTGGGPVQVNGAPITWGTYTPSVANVLNSSGGTSLASQFMRLGNVVTVSGRVLGNASAAGSYQFGVSLPVASNFTQPQQAAGAGQASGSAMPANDRACGVSADAANDRALVTSVASGAGTTDCFYSFTYVVL